MNKLEKKNNVKTMILCAGRGQRMRYKTKYIAKPLIKLQNQYNLGDTDTLADYHQAYWMEYIYNGAKQTDYKNPSNDIIMKLTKRWAFFDKSYKIQQIRKDLEKYLQTRLTTQNYKNNT